MLRLSICYSKQGIIGGSFSSYLQELCGSEQSWSTNEIDHTPSEGCDYIPLPPDKRPHCSDQSDVPH